MFPARKKFFLLLAAGAFFPAQSFASTILYGITLDDNLLQITISPTSVSATLIGTLDTVNGPFGGSSSLGIGQTGGNLYIYDQNQQALLQLDPSTAATISTTNLGILNTGEGDMAFAPSGTGYLVSTVAPDGSFNGTTGSMYSITTAANSASLISSGVPLIDGLTFDANGNAYALAQDGGILYSMTTAGVATEIGTGTGITDGCDGSPCSLGGLTFGGTTLYAALSNFSNSTSSFYTIDPTTGVATFIGDISFDQVSGISGTAASNIPEPSTWILMAGGALAIFLRSRWSHQSKSY